MRGCAFTRTSDCFTKMYYLYTIFSVHEEASTMLFLKRDKLEIIRPTLSVCLSCKYKNKREEELVCNLKSDSPRDSRNVYCFRLSRLTFLAHVAEFSQVSRAAFHHTFLASDRPPRRDHQRVGEKKLSWIAHFFKYTFKNLMNIYYSLRWIKIKLLHFCL